MGLPGGAKKMDARHALETSTGKGFAPHGSVVGGYELANLFNHLSDNVITLSAGNMYPTLYKLEEKGYIRSYEKTVGKRMKRVYYHLTDEGRKELQEMLEDYKRVVNATNAILNFRREELKEMIL